MKIRFANSFLDELEILKIRFANSFVIWNCQPQLPPHEAFGNFARGGAKLSPLILWRSFHSGKLIFENIRIDVSTVD